MSSQSVLAPVSEKMPFAVPWHETTPNGNMFPNSETRHRSRGCRLTTQMTTRFNFQNRQNHAFCNGSIYDDPSCVPRRWARYITEVLYPTQESDLSTGRVLLWAPGPRPRDRRMSPKIVNHCGTHSVISTSFATCAAHDGWQRQITEWMPQ